MRSTIATSLTIAALALHNPASAQVSAGARAMAEGLFRDGKRLMAGARVAEACRKFEASYAIEAAPGTLLNMALCHEQEGKTATAWAELTQSVALAKEAGRLDRKRIAEERLKAIEPRLARVVVTVTEAAQSAAISVKMDDVPMSPGAFGTAIPVDPGAHTLSATAPGRIPWSMQLSVEESQTVKQAVPVLARAPARKPPRAVEERQIDWQRPLGWSAVALGAAGASIGGYFGVRALERAGDRDAHCDGLECDAQGVEADRDARSAATVANVAIGAGVVAAAVGVVMLIVAADGKAASTPKVSGGSAGVTVTPVVAPGVALVTMRGSF